MKDGGPAFPSNMPNSETAHEWGISLRDYFAAKAMPFIAGRAELDHTSPEEWAAACYEIADAMLAARDNDEA